jgi:hypothetical protein
LDIRQLLQKNTTMLEQVAWQTRILRKTYPSVKAPESIFQFAGDDIQNAYREEADRASYISTASSTQFDFDDVIVNAQVYRRVMADTGIKLSQASDLTPDDATIRMPRAAPFVDSMSISTPPNTDQEFLTNVDSLMEKYSALLKDHSSLQKHHAELGKSYQSILQQQKDFTPKLTRLRKTHAELLQDHTSLQESHELLKTTHSNLTSSHEMLQRQNAELERDNSKLQNEETELLLMIARLVQLSCHLRREFTMLSGTNKSVMDRLGVLERLKLQVEGERDRLLKDHGQLEAAFKQFSVTCTKLFEPSETLPSP